MARFRLIKISFYMKWKNPVTVGGGRGFGDGGSQQLTPDVTVLRKVKNNFNLLSKTIVSLLFGVQPFKFWVRKLLCVLCNLTQAVSCYTVYTSTPHPVRLPNTWRTGPPGWLHSNSQSRIKPNRKTRDQHHAIYHHPDSSIRVDGGLGVCKVPTLVSCRRLPL